MLARNKTTYGNCTFPFRPFSTLECLVFEVLRRPPCVICAILANFAWNVELAKLLAHLSWEELNSHTAQLLPAWISHIVPQASNWCSFSLTEISAERKKAAKRYLWELIIASSHVIKWPPKTIMRRYQLFWLFSTRRYWYRVRIISARLCCYPKIYTGWIKKAKFAFDDCRLISYCF